MLQTTEGNLLSGDRSRRCGIPEPNELQQVHAGWFGIRGGQAVWGKDGQDWSNGAETDLEHQVQGLWFHRARVSSPTWPPVEEP